jgi:hypothetical protein
MLLYYEIICYLLCKLFIVFIVEFCFWFCYSLLSSLADICCVPIQCTGVFLYLPVCVLEATPNFQFPSSGNTNIVDTQNCEVGVLLALEIVCDYRPMKNMQFFVEHNVTKW